MSKLKPCPFCGGEAGIEQTRTWIQDKDSVAIQFQIRCKKCKATAPLSYGYIALNMKSDGELNFSHNDLPSATEAWNRRAET